MFAGRLTQTQQDAIESQVGGSLKKCQENIQRLQTLITSPTGSQSGVNTATIAHRQGVVRNFLHFQKHAACLAFVCHDAVQDELDLYQPCTSLPFMYVLHTMSQ